MKYIFIFLIKIYQRTLSRLMPSSCRFYPSCSQYGLEAIQEVRGIQGRLVDHQAHRTLSTLLSRWVRSCSLNLEDVCLALLLEDGC